MPRGIKNLPYVGEAATPVADKEPAKNKRVAPRDRQAVVPLTPEELGAAREKRRVEAAAYTANPPQLRAGHNLYAEVVAATIVDDEIRLDVKIRGMVVRPEQYAVSKETLIPVAVKADVFK